MTKAPKKPAEQKETAGTKATAAEPIGNSDQPVLENYCTVNVAPGWRNGVLDKASRAMTATSTHPLNQSRLYTMVRKCMGLLFQVLLFSFLAAGLAVGAEKAEQIRRIMDSRQFHPSSKAPPFCRMFLQDFTAHRGIKHIDPTVRASKYDAPVFQPYKDRCPDIDIHRTEHCDHQSWLYLESLPKEEREREVSKVCRLFFGTANFQLYELRLKGGKRETLFYSERMDQSSDAPVRPGPLSPLANGGYAAFNASCEREKWVPTHDPYDYFNERPLSNVNGIIQYKGSYYLFDLYELTGADRDETQIHFNMQLEGRSAAGWRPLCYYTTFSRKNTSDGARQ
jgi:hypothetical protein